MAITENIVLGLVLLSFAFLLMSIFHRKLKRISDGLNDINKKACYQFDAKPMVKRKAK